MKFKHLLIALFVLIITIAIVSAGVIKTYKLKETDQYILYAKEDSKKYNEYHYETKEGQAFDANEMITTVIIEADKVK